MLCFPSIPPPMGWSCDPWRFSFWKMATAEEQAITFEETELLSFLCQNIIHHLCEEADKGSLREIPGLCKLSWPTSTGDPYHIRYLTA